MTRASPSGAEAAAARPFGPVAIVGAGAVGTVLAHRCAEAGVGVATVSSRTAGHAARLAEAVGARALPTARADAPVVLVCVPDDAVPAVAAALAAGRADWTGRTAAHTSGVLPAAALGPLARRGAAVLGLHPPRALPPGSDARALDGALLVVEGEDRAAAWGAAFAARLGLGALRLDAAAKDRYHLALSVASNFTVTLAALAAEILGSAGLALPDALTLVRPLVQGTAENLARALPEGALTGPLVRGDAATLSRHLGALSAHLPHLLPAYAALAAETVRVAVRSGRLSEAAAETLLARLSEALPEEDPLR